MLSVPDCNEYVQYEFPMIQNAVISVKVYSASCIFGQGSMFNERVYSDNGKVSNFYAILLAFAGNNTAFIETLL